MRTTASHLLNHIKDALPNANLDDGALVYE